MFIREMTKAAQLALGEIGIGTDSMKDAIFKLRVNGSAIIDALEDDDNE